ncbi:hypothetical protein Clacol_002262 [Clathrus columnatus]|uniref:DUF6699 domain-containing protein n=1 Tax=Clathrus columnatus TaxID=1419009 RepID=A0AAV5A1C1_9AGAM|nr:hypothetical protein Clacol_002262 [Clathrus columnatus]
MQEANVYHENVPHYIPPNYSYDYFPSYPPPATGCTGYDPTLLYPYNHPTTTAYPYIPTSMTTPSYPPPRYSTYCVNGPSRRRRSRVIETGPGQSPRLTKPAAKLPSRPSVPPEYVYTPAQQPDVTPSGLVLPLRGDSQLNWPPKGDLPQNDYWMLHPCLLSTDNNAIPWKWDLSNYPKSSSVLQTMPDGLVLPCRKEDLDAPVIYPNTKNKKIKIFISSDLPIAPLKIKASNDGQLTVRHVFTVLWEYLHTHMPSNWRDGFTNRHFQHMIPIVKANRKTRIHRSGKLASIAEHGRSPKWIDTLGENTCFAGLVPLNQDLREEVREFSLRCMACSDDE